MSCKGQIQQLISFVTVLLFSGIVVFGSLSVAIGDTDVTNANQADITTAIDNLNITEEQQKISSDLVDLIVDSGDVKSGADAYTNSVRSSLATVNDEPEQQLVFVYVSLLQGEETSVIDPYVWNITSRDEENSIVAAWV
uniref:hypothetical protein n=1 Tax=Methanomethylovorans sp. TaxID=2758717 RepID=UPI00351BF59A